MAKAKFPASQTHGKGFGVNGNTNSNAQLGSGNQNIRLAKTDEQGKQGPALTSRDLKGQKESLRAAAKLKREALLNNVQHAALFSDGTNPP